MKRLIYLLMAIMLVVSLAACNGNDADPTDGTTAPTTQTEASKPDVTAPSDSTEPSGGATEPDTQPSDPTEGTSAPSEPDTQPSDPTEGTSAPSEPDTQPSDPIEDTSAPSEPAVTEPQPTEPSHEHSYTSAVTAPTCTSEGYTTFTCACGDSYVGDKLSPKGHSYGAWVTVKEPTTSATGKAERKCENCTAAETRTLDKLIENHTHSYTSSVTKQPTCTADGVRTYTCSCGGSYTERIAKLNHKYTSEVTAPTCSAQGYTTYTCSKCSNSYKDNYKSATGHVNTKTETKAAGCETDGYTKVVCADCGTVISNKVVPSNGSHAYETMRLDAAAKKSGDWYYEKYLTWTDWNVQICRDCCHIDTSTIEFAYTDYEAAEIMLGYVNELREETYGTDYYNLKLDPTLQELAQIRAQEIAENGMYAEGTWTGAHEMMRDGGIGLRATFDDWATLYPDTITNKNYIYFGYGKCEIQDTGDHPAYMYGIMLFWTGLDRSEYLFP